MSQQKQILDYLQSKKITSMEAKLELKQVLLARMNRAVGQNIIQMEQYMDFVRNRTFRATLLCKKGIELNRNYLLHKDLIEGAEIVFHLGSQPNKNWGIVR